MRRPDGKTLGTGPDLAGRPASDGFNMGVLFAVLALAAVVFGGGWLWTSVYDHRLTVAVTANGKIASQISALQERIDEQAGLVQANSGEIARLAVDAAQPRPALAAVHADLLKQMEATLARAQAVRAAATGAGGPIEEGQE